MISLDADVTIGFSNTTYSTAEGNVSVCVSVRSGDLGPDVTVYYFIIAVSNTTTGEKQKIGKEVI